MLFKRAALEGIKAGTISLAFRRWKKAGVTKGSEIHTAVGLVRIAGIAEIDPAGITATEARKAGYVGLAELQKDLKGRDGACYRIGIAYAGADPRIALRADDRLGADELAATLKKLARLSWAADHLGLVAQHPARRAGDLAAMAGLETDAFKTRIRKLKGLGLTESLEVGYRLSPRGKAVLKALRKRG